MTDLHLHPSLREPAQTSKAWPFEEARKLVKRYPDGKPGGEPVLFETGYGPSGLPHIGTFGEVARTTMIRRAFELISDIPTRLFCFSDDMDGMRKVPDNVPQTEMLREHLQKPLTSVPDPFGEYASFAHHNNAMLRRFLDTPIDGRSTGWLLTAAPSGLLPFTSAMSAGGRYESAPLAWRWI